MAAIADVPETWLNVAVKAILRPRGAFDRYLERSHVQVFVAQPGYMRALESLVVRLGEFRMSMTFATCCGISTSLRHRQRSRS